MYQYDSPTCSPTLPAPAAAGTPGYFTDGNPVGGAAATELRSDFMNMLMMELLNLAEAGGQTPSKTAYNQITLAIQALISAKQGSYNGVTPLNTSQALTVAEFGGAINWFGPSGGNLTLPAAASIAGGKPLKIFNYGVGTLNISVASGSDFIYNGLVTTITTIIIQRGDDIELVGRGTNEIDIVGGSGLRQFYPLVVGPATAANDAMQLGQATGRLLGVQVFTSSGTYTPTPGTTSIVAEAIGGGGGGGGANAAGAGQISSGGNGGNGGGGAYAKGRFTAGFSGAAVTIGAGGTAGGTGGTGGTTSLGALISVTGGVGGGAGVAFTPPGSSGGASAGGAVLAGGNIVTAPGFVAQAMIAVSTSTIFNDAGAQSQCGPGPTGGFGNGSISTTKGTGGTGALAGPSTGPYNGGGGAPGILTIWEYA